LSGEPSPFTIVAEEDTLCYLVRKEVFKKLIGEYPDVFLYFTSGRARDSNSLIQDHCPRIPLQEESRERSRFFSPAGSKK